MPRLEIIVTLSVLSALTACHQEAATLGGVSAQEKVVSMSEETPERRETYVCPEISFAVEHYETHAVLLFDEADSVRLEPEQSAHGLRYLGEGNTVFMPSGDEAILRMDGKTYLRCKKQGNALSMMPESPDITGREWVVEDINFGGVIDASFASLSFADGRVSGSASCNRFGGSYELKGDTLIFGPLAMTRKACAPALMDQERRFSAVISGPVTVSIDDTGALILQGSGGSITAR